MSEQTQEKKLGIIPLSALVVGAIVGGGVFNLMSDMAREASLGAIIIGWLIAGLGMAMLAFSFQNLIEKRPDLDAGIYSYAKEGFGNYMGFNAAWGYWLSALLGNVAYATLVFSSLGYFFKLFGNGQNLASVVAASILLWLVHYLILQGVESATFINTIITAAKLIPLAIFFVAMIVAFKLGIFTTDFWGTLSGNFELGEVMSQVKGTMLITVWVFIGIEGAVVFSGRAAKKSDVGKATILGLVTVIAIYLLTTILSLGVMTRPELADLKQPAMAYLLESVVGKWGAILINIGVVISVLGAWLSWTMFAAELPYQAAKSGAFPKRFAKENRNGAPVNSLIFTNVLIQVFIFSFLISDRAYNFAFSLASSAILIPYAFTAFYQLKISIQEKADTPHRTRNLIIGVLASFYGVWLIYAGGIQFFLLTMLLYGPGIIIYAWVQKENKKKLFSKGEWICAGFVILLFIVCVIQLINGSIKIG
ncbi:arginine-ornithine antiporter [Carnobacterium maltaromaticum]|uniref:arginine-ornithine antiporter n=1 Tax=Carnobacterium maltaromaticum TaxID=2751 RepID=UPI0012FC6DE3|nr:arginine-ornithine antiporter [Carnobacterium maltaromaticum]